MAGVDDEFDDFLNRRKPRFRAPDDLFEPPAELDRVVLRQAREAIESDRPVRVFRAPRWSAPIAIAATLVLAFTVMFQAGMPLKPAPVPEVTVQTIAERVEIPDAAAPMESGRSVAANNQAREDAVVVDLATPMMAKRDAAARAAPAASASGIVSNEEAGRYAAPPPSGAPMVAGRPSESMASDAPPVVITTPSGNSTEVPTWRRDAKTWLAEIDRLRNAGDIARADAELAEYKRQQRAYAGAPDR